jgi:homopolymeric O-antigen transport system permease protein
MQHEIVIEAGRTESQYWRDLLGYRELFYFLAWRDILVRYKQTVIGILWAVLRPLLTLLIFVFIFGRVAKLPAQGMPYPVMVFAGLLPWQLFSTSLTECSTSLITNSNLISKVYFPRLIVPASAVIVSFVDFAISFGLLALLMIFYHVWPTWHLLALPFFTLLALIASTGAGLWLAALNVEYRDFRYVVPFFVQLGLYVSPVGFSSSLVRDKLGETVFVLYSLNPVVGVVDGFRWSISGGATPIFVPGLIASFSVMSLLLVSGVWYFRRMERTFADVI